VGCALVALTLSACSGSAGTSPPGPSAIVPPPPGVTVTPEPTPVASSWVWAVFFVEDRTVGSATGLLHVSNVTALDVIDAKTGFFFAGQGGPFDVPPSDGN
jgi:hypothetical protein